MNKTFFILGITAGVLFSSCSDDTTDVLSWDIGEGTAIDYPEDYYAGGKLGTTTNNSSTAYKQLNGRQQIEPSFKIKRN